MVAGWTLNVPATSLMDLPSWTSSRARAARRPPSVRLLRRFPDRFNDQPLGVIRATESQLGGDFSELACRSYEAGRQRWRHINFLARYDFSVLESVARGELWPLRGSNSEYDF
jgi:hypothetical protein